MALVVHSLLPIPSSPSLPSLSPPSPPFPAVPVSSHSHSPSPRSLPLSPRNYHVFYYLLAGADTNLRRSLQLLDVDHYHYLTQVTVAIATHSSS